MGIYRAVLAIIVIVPHFLQNFLAGKGNALVVDQKHQQVKLFGGQRGFLPGHLNAVAGGVDHQISKGIHIPLGNRGGHGAGQYGLHAGNQLPRAERLYHIVIRAALQPGQIMLLENLRFDKGEEKNANEPAAMHLEERFLQHPALAIEQSRITINSMAADAELNFSGALALLENYSDEDFAEVQRMEGMIDRYEDVLGTFLVKLTGRELTGRQSADVSKFLHTISDFERISDHALNVAEAAQEIHQKGITFSGDARHELSVLTDALREILHNAIRAFIMEDLELAKRVEPLEELIDALCDEMKLHHVDRLQKGVCTLSQGFVFNDLLTNYERVADHCSNIAVAMIELEADSFDTHEYLSSVKAMKSAAYERYYEEYRQQFAL